MKGLEESGLSDFVNVVKEPEYSKNKLLKYQEEFNMQSDVFYEMYISGLFESLMPYDKLNDWAFNYEIFLNSNGDINDLNNEDETYKKEGELEDRLLSLYTYYT